MTKVVSKTKSSKFTRATVLLFKASRTPRAGTPLQEAFRLFELADKQVGIASRICRDGGDFAADAVSAEALVSGALVAVHRARLWASEGLEEMDTTIALAHVNELARGTELLSRQTLYMSNRLRGSARVIDLAAYRASVAMVATRQVRSKGAQ